MMVVLRSRRRLDRHVNRGSSVRVLRSGGNNLSTRNASPHLIAGVRALQSKDSGGRRSDGRGSPRTDVVHNQMQNEKPSPEEVAPSTIEF